MAEKTILTNNQAKVLKFISQDKAICQNFYLTGGTVLAEFYLKHRLRLFSASMAELANWM